MLLLAEMPSRKRRKFNLQQFSNSCEIEKQGTQQWV
jgi:hypothetical protein